MRANAALCRAFAEASRWPQLRRCIAELGAAFEDAAAEVDGKRCQPGGLGVARGRGRQDSDRRGTLRGSPPRS
jgi:hypothetical protein